jgi:hypothetical protein
MPPPIAKVRRIVKNKEGTYLLLSNVLALRRSSRTKRSAEPGSVSEWSISPRRRGSLTMTV